MKIESGMMNAPVYNETASRTEVRPKTESFTQTEMKPVAANVTGAPAEVQLQEDGGENASRRIRSAVEHANQTMRHAKTKCEFSYHEETKRVSIKVIDEETEEVIREIPPEETLEMLSKMWELAGLMVDEKR